MAVPQLQLIGCSSSSITIDSYINNKNKISLFSPTRSNSVFANAIALPPSSSSPLLYVTRLMRRKWRKNRVVVRSGTGSGVGGGGGGGSVGGVPAAAGDGVRVRISDVLWPAAGAFAAMAALGRLDQMMAPRGLSITIAPLGAVCAVLFATPNSPAAQKYNMFMAHIGCSAFGVLALSLFGPGWLARGIALAASIAFMIVTGAIHPPAASLPLLFIDGAKLHRLHLWYALFPGAAGCVLLCLIQEMVVYLKNNYKF